MGFREARIQAGKTVRETARFMGVSHAAVCYWECGKTAPRTNRLVQLAEFYGCGVNDLLSGNSVPQTESDKTDIEQRSE